MIFVVTRWLWKALVFIGVLGGSAWLALMFWPKLDVQSTGVITGDFAYANQFRITNTGTWTVRDIEFEWKVEDYSNGYSLGFRYQEPAVHYLRGGESTTFQPNVVFEPLRPHWAIGLTAKCRNFLGVRLLDSHFRFVADLIDGKYYFSPTSISEAPPEKSPMPSSTSPPLVGRPPLGP